jgi:glycosyltransferase involved in cell wall biosynthesis
MVYKKRNSKKVSAIIPAYNEEKTIGRVIKTLQKCPFIGEIIVVDDCSLDNTLKEIKKFKEVIWLSNKKNMGKGGSLDRGTKISRYNTLLFCDGDYLNLNVSHLKKVINPVINGEKDMFIGVGKSNYNTKKSFSKKIGLSFFLAGLRCLKKKRWVKLPKIYKKGYRTEIGITYYCNRYGNGWGYIFLDYIWIKKWHKQGIFRGFLLHFKMYVDLAVAYSFTNTFGALFFWIKVLLIKITILPKNYLLR